MDDHNHHHIIIVIAGLSTEVAKHAPVANWWELVGEELYDVTNFMADHAYGKYSITMLARNGMT